MHKILHLSLASSALLFALSSSQSPIAIAQERQGCFMVNEAGRFIDLSPICPGATNTVRTRTLGTGDIQVTLRWATTDDLDLAVKDPANATVAFFNRSVPSRGQLDVDANAGCSESNPTPIENIFWPPGQAPRGNYEIAVNLYQRCNAGSAPIPFTLTLLVQGTTRTIQGTVSDGQTTATFPFSLPTRAAGSSPRETTQRQEIR